MLTRAIQRFPKNVRLASKAKVSPPRERILQSIATLKHVSSATTEADLAHALKPTPFKADESHDPNEIQDYLAPKAQQGTGYQWDKNNWQNQSTLEYVQAELTREQGLMYFVIGGIIVYWGGSKLQNAQSEEGKKNSVWHQLINKFHPDWTN